jgi:hypothetical protein
MGFKKGDRVVYKGKKEGLTGMYGTVDEIIVDLSAVYVLFDFPSGEQKLVDVYMSNLEHSNNILTVKQWLDAKKRQDYISERNYVVYPAKEPKAKIILGHKHVQDGR